MSQFDSYDAPDCTCGLYDDGMDCRASCARATWLREHTCEYCHALPAYCECPGPKDERRRSFDDLETGLELGQDLL